MALPKEPVVKKFSQIKLKVPAMIGTAIWFKSLVFSILLTARNIIGTSL